MRLNLGLLPSHVLRRGTFHGRRRRAGRGREGLTEAKRLAERDYDIATITVRYYPKS
jgi:hypothetical protein